MSIATKTGDGGETGLVGGKRVSKAHPRVEAYGAVDELSSALGFARSMCRSARVRDATKAIQKDLFTLSGSLANPAPSDTSARVTLEMVNALSKQVAEIEAIEGILGDWAIPGENRVSAAYDVARTACRRAERAIVRLRDSGENVDPPVLAYVNRLSDLLWLFGRLLEKESGVDARLRDDEHRGPNWSRAW
jgi:cob(I)alamin adenosyltransferase